MTSIPPVVPGDGEESVWDYPRPPRVESSARRIRVVVAREVIAESVNTIRVLETSHPPVFYIPPEDVLGHCVVTTTKTSFCEFKGRAGYFDLVVRDRRIKNAGWFYPQPSSRFQALKDHLAFYPSRVDACFVDDEQVRAQEGDFYGGWITREIVGPFKGAPGTWGW